MSSLELPAEIVDELGLPYEGVRDLPAVVMTVQGLNLAASVVTLSALVPHAQDLVRAIRRWRLANADRPMVLSVVGPGLNLKIDLPRNVHTAVLLDRLRPLFELAEKDSG